MGLLLELAKKKDNHSDQMEDDHSTSVSSSSDKSYLFNTPYLEMDSTNEFYGITTQDTATQTCITKASQNDDALVIGETFSGSVDKTKLNDVNINDELRVLRQVRAAEEKLTLTVGELYRVVHLDEACAKLEWLDESNFDETTLTVSINRDDLAYNFEQSCK